MLEKVTKERSFFAFSMVYSYFVLQDKQQGFLIARVHLNFVHECEVTDRVPVLRVCEYANYKDGRVFGKAVSEANESFFLINYYFYF